MFRRTQVKLNELVTLGISLTHVRRIFKVAFLCLWIVKVLFYKY